MAWLSRNFIYNNKSSSNSVTRCKSICKGCVEALIRTGWLLDTSRHSDINDIKSFNSGNNYCCWYYMKSKQGAKLLVFYKYSYNNVVPYFQIIANNGIRKSDNNITDLCLAMIPPGSNSDFGTNPTSEEIKFIPNDSTYLCGDTSGWSKAYNNPGDNEWTFVSDGETIMLFSKKQNSSYEKRYFYSYIIGKVFEILSAPSIDTLPTAKYGVFGLIPTNTNTNWNSNYYHTMYPISGNYPKILTDNSYASTYYAQHASMCFLPDGQRFEYPVSGSKTLGTYTVHGIMYSNVSSSYNDGHRRWFPLYGAICQETVETGQTITPGDGFKGVYDTNIMRVTSMNNIEINQLIDNGNWIYVGGGLLLAWDPSNIVLPCTINTVIDTRDVNNN